MALTDSGLFYLGAEDVASEKELIGKGLRGMFGMPNKDEVVESIISRINPNDPASREEGLRQIASIDHEAFARLSGIFNELETSKIDLETKRLDLKSKIGESDRHTYWTYNVKPNVARLIAKDHGIEASSRTDLVKILNAAVNAGKIKSGSRTTILADFDKRMKLEEENWKRTNKHRDFTPGSKGSNITSAKPNEDKAEKIEATKKVDPNYIPPTQEEYDADPRPVWQKGTIWNYRRPVQVDTYTEDPMGA